MFSESSLSELSDDEEDFVPVKKGKKVTGKKAGEWKLKEVLRMPRQTTYSAQALYGAWHFSIRWRDLPFTADRIVGRGDHARKSRLGPRVPER